MKTAFYKTPGFRPTVPGMKYFVDCFTSTGERKGTIAWPAEDALIVAAGFREEHPDWVVEINPVDTTKA